MLFLVVLASLVAVVLAGAALLRWCTASRLPQLPLLVLAMPLGSVGFGAWALVYFAYRVCWIMTPAWEYRLGIALMLGLAVAVCAALLLSAVRLGLVWRLVCRTGIASGPGLQASLADVARRCGIAPPALVLFPSCRPLAFVCAWPGGPTRLLLSTWLLEQLDARELEGVLAHELAHIVRGDHLVAWLAVLLRDAFYYLPTSRAAFRLFQRRQETSCDELAARVTGRPLALAGALAKVWRAALDQRAVPATGVGLAGAHADVEARIRRLMEDTPWDAGEPAGGSASLVGAASAVVGLTGLQAINIAMLVVPMGCGSLLRALL